MTKRPEGGCFDARDGDDDDDDDDDGNARAMDRAGGLAGSEGKAVVFSRGAQAAEQGQGQDGTGAECIQLAYHFDFHYQYSYRPTAAAVCWRPAAAQTEQRAELAARCHPSLHCSLRAI